MNTPNKPANGATKATAAAEGGPEIKTVMVLEDIKKNIDSALSPANNAYLVPGRDGNPPSFRAEFAFKVNLRRYVTLQSLAARENRTLSRMITFTSAGSDVDTLAVPASMYVRDTWGQDGTKILKTVESAMARTEIRAVPATLAHDKQISITVHKDHLLLNIEGRRASFAKIIEQVCWLVSVAGDTPTARLANFVKETKQGTTTRGYTETVHTGDPIIEPGKGCRFNVSFSAAQVKRFTNQGLVRKSGHCWKTMTELSIIARGFVIPSRPRAGSGLEAPLFVLRQLIKRGCHGTRPLALDKPMVMFPPSQVDGVDKSGKAVQVHKLRLILAADSERPLRRRGNVIYWHFDPSKICASANSIQQLEDGISVESWAIDPSSRHFVGWSKNAGHLTTAPKDIPLGTFCNLTPRGHYELVISSFTPNFRLPEAVALSLTIAAEEVATSSDTKEMWGKRNSALSAVRDCVFVLWDTDFKRGWLVGGDTVALHLLRVHLKTDEDSNEFDFSSLKLLGDDSRSAYSVLEKFNDRKESLNHLKDMEDKPENFDSKQPAENREEAIKRVVGGKLDGIYAVLLQLSKDAQTINKHGGLSGPVLKWYEKKVGTTLRGWDFNQLAGLRKAQIYVYKMDKDPGWLPLARELDVAFLFANGLGPILEPRAGSCCPYFPTLPAGKNLLASGTELLGRFIKRYGGDEESNPPDKTVARLSRSQGWERRLDPFARPNCQGDHLNALGPSCFPVQGTHYAPYDKDREKRWDKEPKLIKGKNLYSKGEIQAMLGKNAKGIVVFGRQPGSEELKDMCRQQSTLGKSGTQPTVNAASAAAQPSSRPSSRGATPGSTRSTASAADPKLPMKAGTSSRSKNSVPDAKGARASTKAPGEPSVATSTGRAPSVASIGSTDSSRQRKASGADSGVERPQASTPQASPASAQRTASISSVRSTASNPHLRAPSTPIGAGQPRTSSPQALANSTHKTASNASLRSISSDTRPRATVPSSGQPGGSTAEPNARTAARKPSNSSVRTTSSVESKATGGSTVQIPAAQPPIPALKKTTTDSSDRTTSSRTSRSTQSSAAGSTSANSNQRQQRLGQLSAATAATAMTDGHHSTSSGPAPAAGGGQDG